MAAFTPALSTAIDLLARYIVRSLEQKTYASTYHRAPPRNLPRPWTVSVAFRILIADEMNFAPKKIFFSAKMLLFSKNSGLIVASITGASKRGFKRFVPRISTVYPAWFRAAIFPSRKGKIFDAAGRIEKRAVAVSNRWTVSGIPKAFC